MVRHEAVRQTPYRNPLLRLAKHPEKGSVITRPIEESESADAPIQDVKHDATRSDRSSARTHDDRGSDQATDARPAAESDPSADHHSRTAENQG